VGFGDITPEVRAARVVLIVRMLGGIAFLGAGARVLLGAVRRGQQGRLDGGGDARSAAACLAGLAAGDFTGQARAVLALVAPAPAGCWQPICESP
jgi:hypothetical protein